jgi:hypothetical protein
MAIVINGSGTVTGLSVGGLPDGTVDAGTLASNAVTEAKIASNAVVTTKLNDDAVTNAKMANDAITEHELAGSAVVTAAINDDAITAAKLASGVGGKVLQVVEAADTGEYDSNNTSLTNIPNLSVALTPSASSSKFLVLISLGGVGTHSSNQQNSFALRRAISGGATSVPYVMTRSSAHDAITNSNVFGYDTQGIFLDEPSTASAITYSVQMAAQSGYARINANMGTNDCMSSIAVMEIGA